ncbi:hypothetical protein GTA08_BOTSDO05503 [Botryosphaeria dothidea]|uniref:Uncharacterized protein n=1 Tax=Botryosphaeria dothidea TaxID=55169 RepID=A0A8H4IT56_9PEZI|nr:hypothetical protein GTA08_BOTSDO05503 [Botryosphaeria dothidea]
MDRAIPPIVLMFSREPESETPEGAVCATCERGFPDHHDDHYDDYHHLPIQMPCGCVHHFSCIEFWLQSEAATAAGDVIQLSCFSCGRMIDHDRLDYVRGVNEAYVVCVDNEAYECMIIALSIIIAQENIATVNPQETTFVNPHPLHR